ncbi:TcpQ domain-containing protein [Orrella sp. JC864]|uniref:TcpQ domain-containing protein n=1 Tax=Orrella sp. JC864 TaxID=3120298 RepID=UPI0030089C8A
MKPCILFLSCAAVLPACTAPSPSQPPWPSLAAAQGYDFNWSLSGDRAVAPLQVFHDGRDTWLHFPPGQPVPALFVSAGQGERLAAYTRRDPYVVVQGVWPAITLRGGRSLAQARYLGPGGQGAAVPAQAGPMQHAHALANSPAGDTPDVAAAAGPVAAALPVQGPVVTPGSAATGAASAAPPKDGTQPPAAPTVFHASPADGTMRALLGTWSRQAGWTFENEHWAVDVDIPLSGSASFSNGYREAVRALLAASELGERPVQPCFYANRVLRVVALNEPCDRSAGERGAI